MADHQPSAGGSGSGQNLWSRLTSSRARRDDDDDEEDTEPLLPARSSTKGRSRLWPGWEQVAVYLVVLVLCFGAGWFTSRAFTRRGTETKGNGPMVPPVWTLPPVSPLSPVDGTSEGH